MNLNSGAILSIKNAGNPQSGKITIASGAELKIDNDMKATEVLFNGGTFTCSAKLVATTAAVTIGNSVSVSHGGACQITAPNYVTSSSVTVAGKITGSTNIVVNTGSTFIVTNANALSTPTFQISGGAVTIKQGQNGISTTNFQSGFLTFDSTTTGFTYDGSLTLSESISVTCASSNSISLSGTVSTFGGIILSGGNSCTFTTLAVPAAVSGRSLSVDASKWSLPSLTLGASTTLSVINSGDIYFSGSSSPQLTIPATATATVTSGTIAAQSGNTKVSLSGSLIINSAGTFNLDLVSTAGACALSVNNVGATVNLFSTFTMGSNSWSFTSCSAVNLNSDWTLSKNLAIGSGCLVDVKTASSKMTIGTGSTVTVVGTLKVSSSGAQIIVTGTSGAVAGSGTITISQGTFTVNQGNTISTSNVQIVGGTLSLTTSAATFSSTAITHSSGTLALSTQLTLSGGSYTNTNQSPITSTGGIFRAQPAGATPSTVTFTLTGGLTLLPDVTIVGSTLTSTGNTHTLTFSGAFTAATTATINLGSQATFSGTVAVGNSQFSTSALLTLNGATTTFQSAATVTITGGLTMAASKTLSIDGSTFSASGAIDLKAGSNVNLNTIATATFTGTAGSNTRTNFQVNGGSTLNLSGVTIDAGRTVATNGANSKIVIQGAVTINSAVSIPAGSFQVASAGSLTLGNTITVNNAALLINGDMTPTGITLQGSATLDISGAGSSLTMGSSSTLTLSSQTVTIDAGTLYYNSNNLFTYDDNNFVCSNGGSIVINSPGDDKFNIEAGGEFRLTGCTFNNQRGFDIDNDGKLTAQSGTVIFASAYTWLTDNTLELGGSVFTHNGMTFTASSRLYYSNAASEDLAGTITMDDNSLLQVSNNNVLTMKGSTIFKSSADLSVITGGKVIWETGATTALYWDAKITIDSQSMYVKGAGSRIDLYGSSELIIDGALLNIDFGIIYLHDYSKITFKNGATLKRPTSGSTGKIYLRDYSSLEIKSSLVMSTDTTFFDINISPPGKVKTSGTVTVVDNLDIPGPSCVSYDGDTTVLTVQSTQMHIYNDGCVTFDNAADLILATGALLMENTGSLTFTSSTPISTTFTSDSTSSVTIKDNAIITLIDSKFDSDGTMTIQGQGTNNFVLTGTTTFNSKDNIIASVDSMIVSNAGTTFNLIGDVFNLQSSSTLTTTTSAFNLAGGSLSIEDTSSATFDSTTVVEVAAADQITLTDSGALILSGASTLNLNGKIDMSGSTYANLVSSTLNVNDGGTFKFNGDLTSSVVVDSLSYFYILDNGDLQLLNAGTFEVQGTIDLAIGGSLSLLGSSILKVNSATALLDLHEAISLDGTSSLTVTNGQVKSDSSLTFGTSSKLQVQSAGVVSFTSGTLFKATSLFSIVAGTATLNTLTFNAGGSLSMSSGAQLTANGVIDFNGATSVSTIDASTLTANAAITMNSNAQLTVQNNGHIIFNTASSTMTLGTTSKLAIVASDISVPQSLILNNNAKVTLTSAATLRSTGNSGITLNSQSILSATDSTLEVNGADIYGSGSASTFTLTNTDVLINSAHTFRSKNNLNILSTSNVFVNAGEFLLDSSTATISSSTVDVDTKFTVQGTAATTTTFLASNVIANAGSIISYTGSTNTDSQNSFYTLASDLEFSSNHISDFTTTQITTTDSISLKNNAEVTLNQVSYILVNNAAASLNILDNSVLSLYTGSYITVTSSTINLSTDGSLVVDGAASEITLTSSTITLADDSIVSFQNNADLNTDQANIYITEFSSFKAQSGSLMSLVANSLVNVKDSANLVLSGAEFVVDGTFLAEDSSVVSMTLDAVITLTGSLNLQDLTTLSLDTSSINVQGSLSAINSAVVSLKDSTITLNGGTVVFSDTTQLNFLDAASTVTVTAGSLTIQGTAQMNTLTGNSFSILGNFHLIGDIDLNWDGITITVSGVMDLKDNAKIHISTSTVNVIGSFETYDNFRLYMADSTISVSDDKAIMTFDGISTSVLNLVDSNMFIQTGVATFKGYTSPLLQTSQLEMSSGNLFFIENTAPTFTTSDFVLSNGIVTFTDDSNTHFDSDSTISITLGSMVVEGDAYFTTTSSDLTVNSGSVSFLQNSNTQFTSGDFKVLGGTVLFSNSSIYSFVSSHFIVDGGNVYFYGDSEGSFNGINFQLLAGNVFLDENAKAHFSNEAFSIDAGILLATLNAQITFLDSTVSINTGSLVLEDYATATLTNTPLQIITVPLSAGGDLSLSDTSVISFTNSPITLQGGDVVLHNQSQFKIMDPASILYLNGGDFTMYENSEFISCPSVVITVAAGNFLIHDLVEISLTSASVSISDNMKIFDTASLYTYSSTIDILSGVFQTNDGSYAYFEDSDLTILGNLQTKGTSVVDIKVGSKITINTGAIITDDSSQFSVWDSQIDIAAGDFTVQSNSKLTVKNTDVNLKGDLTLQVITTRAQLFDTATIVILGNLLITETSHTTFTASSITITSGALSLQKQAVTTFLTTPIVIKGGVLVTRNDSISSMSGGYLTIQADAGSAMAMFDNSFFSFTSAPISLSSDLVLFNSATLALLDVAATLTIDGGNFYLYNTAHFNTVPGTVIALLSGNFKSFDSVSIAYDRVIMNVDGLVELHNSSQIQMSNSTINIPSGSFGGFESASLITSTNSYINVNGVFSIEDGFTLTTDQTVIYVSGSFSTYNDVQVTATNTNVGVVGNVLFSGNLASKHSFTNVNFHVQAGSVHFTQDIDPTFTTSTITVDGGSFTIDVNVKSTMTSSFLILNGGSLYIKDDTNSLFITTPVTINGGLMEITENSNVQFTSTSPLLIQTSVSGMALNIRNTADVSFDHSTITLKMGDLRVYDDATFAILDPTSILTIDGGNFYLYNTAHFTSVPGTLVSILSGNFKAYDDVSILFNVVTMNVDGIVELHDRSQLSMSNTTIAVTTGSFSGLDNAKLITSSNSYITVDGTFTIANSFTLITDQTVIYVSGSLSTYNDVQVTATNTAISIDGNVLFSGLVSSKHSFTNVNFHVQAGSVHFTQDIDPTFTTSIITVDGGSFTIDVNVKSTMTSSFLTLNGGSLYIKDDTNSLFITTPVTINGGLMEITENSNVQFTSTSPLLIQTPVGMALNIRNTADVSFDHSTITLNQGDLRVYDDATFAILDPTSILTIDGGNFYLYNTAHFTSVPGTLITIQQGNYKAYDDVDTLFNVVTMNVAGIVELNDRSRISMSNTTIAISTGSFTGFDFAKLITSSNSYITVDGTFVIEDSFTLTTDQTVIYVSGSFSTYNDIQFTATNTNIDVVGNVLFSGNLASKHSFTNVNFHVQAGSVHFTQDIDPTFTTSTITVDGGSFTIDVNVDTTMTSSFFNLNGGSLYIKDDTNSLFITTPVTINGGLMEISEDSTVKFTSLSPLVIQTSLGTALNIRNTADVSFDHSPISIIQGDLTVYDDATFAILDPTSTLTLNGGNFYLYDTAHFNTVPGTLITIQQGNYKSYNDVNTFFNVVTMIVNGFVEFRDNSVLSMSNSTIRVPSGSFGGYEFAQLLVSSQSLLDVNGVFFIQDDFTFTIDDSVILVSGSLTTYDRVQWTATNTIITVTGNVVYSGTRTSLLSFSQVTLTVNNGNTIFTEDVDPDFTGSSITVNAGYLEMNTNTYATIHTTPTTVNGGSFYLKDNIFVDFTGSPVSIFGGLVELTEFALANLTSSTLTVNTAVSGDALNIKDESIMNFVTSPIYLYGGDLSILNNATLSLLDVPSFIVIDGGNFIMRGTAHFNTVPGTVINIFSGNFMAFDLVDFVFHQVDMFVNGNVELHDNTRLVMFNSNIEIPLGSFTGWDAAQLFVYQNSNITVNGYFAMHEKYQLSMDQSSIYVGGNFSTYNDIHFIGSSSNLTVDGFVTFSGNVTSVHSFKSLHLVVSLGDVTFTELVDPVFDISIIDISYGSFVLEQLTNTTIRDTPVSILVGQFIERNKALTYFLNSPLTISGGFFNAKDTVDQTFDNSPVAISGGSFTLQDDVKSYFTTSSVTVTGGSYVLLNNVSAVFSYSPISISVGSFDIENDVIVSYSNSPVTINSGSFYLKDSITSSFTDSAITILGGLVQLSESAQSTLVNSALTVDAAADGQAMNVNNDAFISFTNSPILLTQGDLTLNNFATITLLDTASSVTLNGGNFILNDRSEFYTVSGTSISVIAGNFQVFDFVNLFFDHVTLTVDGRVEFHDLSQVLAITTYMTIPTGTFVGSESGNFTMLQNSQVDVNGLFTIKDDFYFFIDSSSIQVTGTIETFDNVQWTATNTIISVDGTVNFAGTSDVLIQFTDVDLTVVTGNVIFREDVDPDFSSSTVTIQSGSLLVENNAIASFDSTPVVINGGTFTMQDYSFIQYYLSPLTINAGEVFVTDFTVANFFQSPLTINTAGGEAMYLQNNATLNFFQSPIYLKGGDLYLGGDSVVNLLDPTSTIEVQGGTFSLHDNAVINTVPGSIISILGGDFKLLDNVFLDFVKVHVQVNGIVELRNHTVLQLTESILDIPAGQLRGFEHAKVLVYSDSVFNIFGAFAIHDNFTFTLKDSTLNVTGLLSATDLVSWTSLNSTIHVTGNVDLSGGNGGGALSFTEVEFSVEAGSVSISDFIQPDFVDSQLIINGGNLYFNNDTQSSFLNTPIQILVGALVMNSNSYSKAHNSPLTIQSSVTGSAMQLNDNSVFEFELSSIILSGDLILRNYSTLALRDSVSSLTIINGGNFLLYDNSNFFTVVDSHVSVLDGNFKVNNYVDMSFDTVTLLVNGYVEFTDYTKFSMQNTNVTIPSGTFNALLNTDISMTQSSYLDINGVFNIADDSSLTIDASQVFVTGQLSSSVNVQFIVSNSDITVDGNVDISGAVTGVNSFSNVQMLVDSGSMRFFEYADPSFTSSNLTINTGSLYFDENSNSVFDNTDVYIATGSFVQTLSAVSFFTDSSVSISGGSFTQSNFVNTHFLNTPLTISAGNFLQSDNVISLFESSDISISGGYITIQDDTNSDFTQSPITVSGGSVTLKDRVQSDFVASPLSISGGSFTLQDSVIASFATSGVTVTGGSYTLQDNVNAIFTDSPISISVGSVVIQNVVIVSYSNSPVTINSGSFYLKDSITSSFTDSAITILGGLVQVSESAQSTLVNSALTVDAAADGQAMNVNNNAFISFTNSPILLTQGDLTLNNFATIQLLDALSTVTLNGGNFILNDNTQFLTVPGTSISVIAGKFQVFDNVILTFDQVTLTVDDSVEFHDSSDVVMSSSTVVIAAGSLVGTEVATLTVNTNSEITVNGLLSLHDSFGFSVDLSQIYVTGTIETFDLVQWSATNSDITVDGNINLNGDVTSTHSFDTVNIHITTGSFTVAAFADPSFVDTSVDIQQGSFYLKASSSSTFDNTDIVILIGSLSTEDSAITQYFSGSSLDIQGGSYSQSGSSSATFSDSIVTVEGGNLLLSSSTYALFERTPVSLTSGFVSFIGDSIVDFKESSLTVQTGDQIALNMNDNVVASFFKTPINLYGGDFTMNSNSTVILEESSCVVTIDGGNLYLYDNVHFETSVNTIININSGNFHIFNQVNVNFNTLTMTVNGNVELHHFSEITMTSSLIDIPSGSFTGFEDGTLTMNSNSHVKVNGLFQIQDNFNFNIDSSIIDVTGTLVAQNNVQWFASNTNINVDGSVSFSGLATSTISFASVNLAVNQGAVVFSENVTPSFVNSAIDINIGSFTVTDSTSTSFTSSSISIVGTFSQLLSSSIDLQGTPTSIQGGSLIQQDSSKAKFFNSAVTIESGSYSVSGDATSAYKSSPFTINGGFFEVSNFASLSFENSPLVISVPARKRVNSGEAMVLNNNATVSFTGSAITLLEGDLVINDYASFHLIDSASTVTLDGGNLILNDNANFTTAIGTLIDIKRGNFNVNDRVIVNYEKVTMIVNGAVLLTSDATFNMQNSTVNIPSGSFTVSGSSIFNIYNNSTLNVTGTLDMIDNASFTATKAAMTVLGSINVNNHVDWIVSTSTVYVDGNIIYNTESDSILTFTSTQFLIKQGTVTFKNSGKPTFTSCTFAIIGSLLIQDDSIVDFSRTTIKIGDGMLSFSDNTQAHFNIGSINLDSGNFIAADSARLSLISYPTTINTGTASFADNSVATFESSNLNIKAGSLGAVNLSQFANVSFKNSSVNLLGGDITVADNSTFALTDLLSPLTLNGGNFYLRDSSIFTIVPQAVLTIISGNFEVYDYVSLNFNRNTLSVSGFFETHGVASLNLVDSFITIPTGELNGFDDSSMTLHNSDIDLKGTLSMHNNFNFDIEDSSITITGTLSSYDDIHWSAVGTTINVNGNVLFSSSLLSSISLQQVSLLVAGGSVQFTNNAHPAFDHSTVALSAGSLSFESFSKPTFDTTPISIQGGSFISKDNSIVAFTSSPVTLENGSFTIQDFATASFTLSAVSITGGSMNLASDADFTDSAITINGGSVNAHGSVVVDLLRSPLSVLSNSGSALSLYDSASFKFSSSAVQILGGSVALFDESSLVLQDVDSSFVIQTGSFILHDNSTLVSTVGTTITINQGNFNALDSVSLSFSSVALNLKDGNLSFNNSASLSSSGSVFKINGELGIYDDSAFYFENGAMNISGNFIATHTSLIQILKSTVFVQESPIEFTRSFGVGNTGSYLSLGNSSTVITDTSLTIDGLFQIGEFASFSSLNCDIFVNFGEFLTSETSNAQFNSTNLTVFGVFSVDDYSTFLGHNLTLEVVGEFHLSNTSVYNVVESFVNINGGNFSTLSVISSFSNSFMNVAGNAYISGETNAIITFSQVTIAVLSGNMTFAGTIFPNVSDSNLSIVGGYFEVEDNTVLVFDNSSLSLTGLGSIVMTSHTHWVLYNSFIEINAGGASATFTDNSIFELFDNSQMNITDGNIIFNGDSTFNLMEGTSFNLLGGSFILGGNAVMIAYPDTYGTIYGGTQNQC